MAKIIPIKDFKNTSAISSMCHDTEGPIYVTKNGYDDLVLMSMEEYERLTAKLKIYSELFLSQSDIETGQTKDAFAALSDMRDEYGL